MNPKRHAFRFLAPEGDAPSSGTDVVMSADAMSAAVADIGASLGFSADSNEDLPSDPSEGASDADKPEAAADGEKQTAETPAEGTPEKAAAGGPDAAAATDPAKPAGTIPAAPKPLDINTLPETWKPALGAKFAALDPEVKAEIHRREGDIFKGIEQWRQAANVGERYHKAAEPFLPALRVANIDPIEHVATLMSAHHTLSVGTPQAKLDMFKRIGREYGLDLAKVVDMPAAGDDSPYVSPEVLALREKVEAIESRESAQRAAEQSARMQEVARAVDRFSSDPARVHFVDVYQQMIPLVKAGVSLEDAYEQAVWANPGTRAKEIAKLDAAKAEASRVQREAEDARARAAKKSAGFGVKSSPKSNSGTAKAGTIDDTLQEAYDTIMARDS